MYQLSQQYSPFQTSKPNKHTNNPRLTFLRGWKQITCPLSWFLTSQGSWKQYHIGGITPSQSSNKSWDWCKMEMPRMVRAFSTCSLAWSRQPRDTQQAPLFLIHSIIHRPKVLWGLSKLQWLLLLCPWQDWPSWVYNRLMMRHDFSLQKSCSLDPIMTPSSTPPPSFFSPPTLYSVFNQFINQKCMSG